MASYSPPKRATELIFYLGLTSQTTGLLQSNPTIAAGDFKVSIDGGALANLTTLPAVTPAASRMVKVTLSNTEMTGDNITVVAVDAAGSEWVDALINIQPSVRQIDDLAFPTTSGRSIDVTATGTVGIDWSNVENQGSTVDLSATTIANVDTTEAIGATGLASINAEVVDTLNVDTYPEPTVVPPATTTLVKKIGWQQAIARNKLTQTATTQTLRNDADNADIATSTVSDDSTTAIRGEFT